jgi:hypothetical protein
MSAVSRVDSSAICKAPGMTSTAASHSEQIPLAYGNRAEVELMLGDNRAAAADVAQAQSVAATMSDSPAASGTPSARKNQTQRKTPRTGTTNNSKGTTR